MKLEGCWDVLRVSRGSWCLTLQLWTATGIQGSGNMVSFVGRNTAHVALVSCPPAHWTSQIKGRAASSLVSNNNKKRFIEKRFLGKEKKPETKSQLTAALVLHKQDSSAGLLITQNSSQIIVSRWDRPWVSCLTIWTLSISLLPQHLE